MRQPATTDLLGESLNLARRLGLRGTPGLWLIDGIAQPFVWGPLAGSIYLPADFGRHGTAEHRRGILMHELAHIARYDAAINLLQVLVQAAFFFHPLVWWANKRIRQEREKCCDEIAIAHLGGSPRRYGEAIVESLVREYASTRAVSSLAIAGPVKNIEERIQTILRPNRRFYRGPSRLAVVCVLLLGALSIPTALVLTVQPATEEPAAAPAGDSNVAGKPAVADAGAAGELAVTHNATNDITPPAVSQPADEPQEAVSAPAMHTQRVPAHYKGTLPNGVTVELLGGSRLPPKDWWRPGGGPLHDIPRGLQILQDPAIAFETPGTTPHRPVPGPRDMAKMPTHAGPDARMPTVKPTKPIEPMPGTEGTPRLMRKPSLAFAVQLGEIPKTGATVTHVISPSADAPVLPRLHVRSQDHDRPLIVSGTVPESTDAVTVQVGVATGDWTTRSTVRPEHQKLACQGLGTVTILLLHPSGDRTLVTTDDTIDGYDLRVVALDAGGTVHEPSILPSAIVVPQNPHLSNIEFDLEPARIASLQIQTRPYDWISFRNVTTSPNHPTEVEVRVLKFGAKDGPAASKPPGSRPAGSQPSTPPAAGGNTILPGVGLEIIQVDDPIGKIQQVFGEPDERTESQKEGIWISYRPSLGIDFWAPMRTKRIQEIRFNKGFEGRMPDGIHIGSTLQEVLAASGGALKTVTVSRSELDAHKAGEDRVLYRVRAGGLLGFLGLSGYEFVDAKRGMLYWFDKGGKAIQIVTYAPGLAGMSKPMTQPAAASQAAEPLPGWDLTHDLKGYPSQAPQALFEALKANILDEKWNYASGDLYSFTLRNSAPQREARRNIFKIVDVTPRQTKLLVDASICFIDVAGTDDDAVTVQATIFVRSRTSGQAADAFARQIDVELAVDGPNVRLGDHYATFRSRDIESAGVMYTVKLPRRMAVDVRIPNGRLCVRDIDGGLTFIGGGSVAGEHIAGPVYIRNNNGRTLLHDTASPQKVSIDQGNGSVALLRVAGPLDLRLGNGGVYLDARLAAPSTCRAIVDHGQVNIVGLDRPDIQGFRLTASAVTLHGSQGQEELQARSIATKPIHPPREPSYACTVAVIDGTMDIWMPEGAASQPAAVAPPSSQPDTDQ